MKVIFIVADNNKDCQYPNRTEQEFHHHGDLLWLQAPEHYRSGLTRKTMTLIHFAHFHMNTFRYLFKTDDDVYINVTRIEQELLGVLPSTVSNHTPDDDANTTTTTIDYYGLLSHNKPIRRVRNKFYISKRDYPDEYFPIYAPGFGYALSNSFCACSVQEFPLLSFIPWEDVSVGLLAKNCNVSLTNAQESHWSYLESYKDWGKLDYHKYKKGGHQVSILHGLGPRYMRLFHQGLPLLPPPPRK
jgi:hypothetical protein